jgi:hypothetical protein
VQLTDAVRELRTLGEAELHVIDSLVA